VQFSNIRALLSGWACYSSGWDGDEGVAPGAAACTHAQQTLAAAEIAGLTAPVPFIAADGEIGFRWRSSNGFASISFIGGDVIGFCRAPGVAEPLRVDKPFVDVNELQTLLAAVYRLA
jgi:hypothetical protein